MADINFEVRHRFTASSQRVWDELVDWKRHEEWIPATTMEVGPGDPTAVGHELTARTGIGPLALPDRMRVAKCDWDEATASGDCVVEKLGPVLRGRAGFTVVPDVDAESAPPSGTSGCVLDWFEEVTVRYLPQFVAPIGAWIGAFFFRQGMRKLDGVIRR